MAVARYSSALALIAFLVSSVMVMATEYEVDWETGVDFNEFATANTFFTGDVLHFHYDDTAHDIIMAVDGDAFDNCQMTPNLGHFQSGVDSLALSDPGYYYFMCEYRCATDDMKMLLYVNQR